MLPLQAKVNLGAMAMKEYSILLKAEASSSDGLESYPGYWNA